MAYRELEALRQECTALEVTLSGVAEDAWSVPGLGEWNLAELVAHLVGGVQRLNDYLDGAVEAGADLLDAVEYYRYDPDEISAGVAERARTRAAEIEPTQLPGLFSETWRAAVARVEAEPADPVIPTFRGPMRLREYLRTRVLEVVVHHMDVCTAVGVPPVATPDAARLTMALLEGLLGSRRPRNFGRARFIKAATGRISVDDPRFPVLS